MSSSIGRKKKVERYLKSFDKYYSRRLKKNMFFSKKHKGSVDERFEMRKLNDEIINNLDSPYGKTYLKYRRL